MTTSTSPDLASGLLSLLGETRASVVMMLADEARTAAELSDELGISQVAVRRHVARLLDEGWVAGRTDDPTGPGRPVTRYHLTTDGHELLPQGYAALATELLAFIEDTTGTDGLQAYLGWRSGRRVRRLAEAIDATDLDGRLVQLAEALTQAGSTASVELSDDGLVLRQHHCTVLDVAREHPELCHAEAAEFSRVLGDGVHIERGSSRASGDGTCECAVMVVDPPPAAVTGTRPTLPLLTRNTSTT